MEKSQTATAIKVFLFIYTIVFLFLTISSVAPFKEFVEFYIGINLNGFYEFASSLPFFGQFFIWLTINGIFWIIGFLVCIVFNFFETILFIRTLSKQLTLIDLATYGTHDQISTSPTDDAFVAKLKKVYNDIPKSLFKAFLNIGLFLGGLDIAIHWSYYDVIRPGGSIDIGEFVRGLGSLLWVEMFCYAYLALSHYISTIKSLNKGD